MAEWKNLSIEKYKVLLFNAYKKLGLQAVYGSVEYRTVASSRLYPNPFILKFNGQNFDKITEGASTCEKETVDVDFSERNRLLARLKTGEIALIHPAACSTVSEVLIKVISIFFFI